MAEKIDKTLRAALLKDAEAIHAKDAPYKRAADKEFILWLVIVLALALAVRLFVFEPVRVVGDSMHDTLVNGERMLVEKVSYLFREPQRSDIIICFYPHHTTSCVKRVIGIGGDTVAIRDGILYLNGESSMSPSTGRTGSIRIWRNTLCRKAMCSWWATTATNPPTAAACW